MQRQVKLMVLANVLLGLLFVLAFLAIQQQVESLLHSGGRYSVSDVSPLWIQVDSHQPPPYIEGPHFIPNYPFYMFWVVIAVNLYFIFRLQRSKGPS